MTLVACNRAAAEPETGAVHPYPGSPPDRLVGELCEVWFTTDVALEDLTRVTHHHHFSLRPCGDTEDTGTLWMGSIYAAHSTDAASHPDGTHLYKAYFPLSFARLREHAHGFAHRNPEQVIESAIRRGLCIRVGGGQMWGVASLASNAMRVPVVFTHGDALVIDDG